MSQHTDDLFPPDLSQYSAANTASPISPVGKTQEDKQLEVELIKLRIQEMDKRIELEKLIQQRQTSTIVEHERSILRDCNKFSADDTRTTERQLELPRREIQRFDGNPKLYWSFTKAFDAGIEKRTNDNQARLDYLIQYCDGPAKAAIQHCTVLEEDRGYLVAKETLRKRFGQNHMIAKTLIDELLDGPHLAENDSAALLQLAQQMTVCNVTLQQLDYDSDLNASRTIESIVRRLPPELHFRWADEAAVITRRDREPSFADLTRFVEERADAACMRYGELAINLRSEMRGTPKQLTARSNPYGAKRNFHLVHGSDPSTDKPNVFQLRCSICEESHFPDRCTIFLSMTQTQRLDTVRTKKLCLQCLKANHIAKDCRSTRNCSVEGCGRKHHRLLHAVVTNATDDKTSTFTNHHAVGFHPHDLPRNSTDSQRTALAVVPVTLCYAGRSVQTCAFLDSGSDCTLVDEAIISKLRIQGCRKQIKLCTLNRDTVFESVAVKLDVTVGDSNTVIHVEQAWSVKSLPKLRPFRPSDQQLLMWPHLRDISFNTHAGSEIGVLIGCDVPEAHWIIEQRKGKPDEPYAIRTVLGWTLLGPISKPVDTRVTVNLLNSEEVQENLDKLYQPDFVATGPQKEKELSVKDRQAHQTMEISTRLDDGHHEVKDKRPLLEVHKEMEQYMERFQLIEKEMKTEAYSKEGLLLTDAKKDPLQKEKKELDYWLKQCISSLNTQMGKFEFEIESLTTNNKKRIDKATALANEKQRQRLKNCSFHVEKLETIMRLLDNERLDCAILRSIKDPIDFITQSCDDVTALHYKNMYDDLRLDEIGDSSGITPCAVGNPSENEVNDIPVSTVSHRDTSDDASCSTSTHTSAANQTDSSVNHPASSTSSNASSSRERRKSDEKVGVLNHLSSTSTSLKPFSGISVNASGVSSKSKSSSLANQTAPSALMFQVVACTPNESNRSFASYAVNGLTSPNKSGLNKSLWSIADKRKLQNDVDRTLKRVQEGRAALQDILDKFRNSVNQTQKEKLSNSLQTRSRDWMFNPPKVINRGRWEMIIQTVKHIILVTLQEQTVSDEILHTTPFEIERIINDRLLMKQTDDPEDQYVLTLSKLLMLRRNCSLPITMIVNENCFNRRWRVAQYLTDVFWRKWMKCYLPTLQTIQRWQFAKPNLKMGDLVLLLDLNAPRGQWSKAVIEEAHEGLDGLVRDVIVKTANGKFRRNVRQLCKLEGDLVLAEFE